MRTQKQWLQNSVIPGLLLTLVAGCQTWVPEVAMTLPSPYYLRHPPQYIPPSPPYPLPRETAAVEEAWARQAGAVPGAPAPGGFPGQ